jgi:hypothetical protein
MATPPHPPIPTSSPRRRTPFRLALACASALTVLTVGACGDSADDPAATPTSTPATTAPSTATGAGSTTTTAGGAGTPTTTAAAATTTVAGRPVTTAAPATTAAATVTTLRPPTTTTASSALPLRGDGIGPLVIGRDSANDVINTISAVLGAAVGDNATQCGSGADRTVRWDRAPLIVVFDKGTFVGYVYGRPGATSTPALTTPTGLGLTSTRADLQRVYPSGLDVSETSLGTEFHAGDGVGGLLDGPGTAARIATIGAGDWCAFR